MDLHKKRQDLEEEREAFIIQLWVESMWRNSHSELLKFNHWKKIYDTLTFPWDKPYKFHLMDKKIEMQTLRNLGKEKHIDQLDNNTVVNTLRYFSDNLENVMRGKVDEYKFEQTKPEEDLSYESHSNRELSTANKKQYVESLLSSLQERKSQNWPWSKKILISENLYSSLEKLYSKSDQEKLHYLEMLCDFLPNHDRELRPDAQDINWIFENTEE